MAARRKRTDATPLDAAVLARFRDAAPGALARRRALGVWPARLPALLLLATAVGNVAGIATGAWSVGGVFVFTLVGAIGGSLAEALRYLLLRAAVERAVAEHNADRFVWNVADALRAGHDKVDAYYHAPYKPKVAMFFDAVFSLMGGGMLTAGMVHEGVDLVAAWTGDRGLRLAVGAMLVLQFGGVLAQWVALRGAPAGQARAMIDSGSRGIALFLMLMLFAFVAQPLGGGGMPTAILTLVLANLGLVALAVLLLVVQGVEGRRLRWIEGWLAVPPAQH